LSNHFETDFRFCPTELRGHCVLLFFTTLQTAEIIKSPSSYYFLFSTSSPLLL